MLDYIAIGLLLVNVVLLVIIMLNQRHGQEFKLDESELNRIEERISRSNDAMQKSFVEMMSVQRKEFTEALTNQRIELQHGIDGVKTAVDDKLSAQRLEMNNNVSNVNNGMQTLTNRLAQALNQMQEQTVRGLMKVNQDTQASLDRINDTVNEKLQKTLEERLNQSFNTVSRQLAIVYQGLGEMKDVATGVSDLKKVLSNVKTRGIIGEYQLENILSEILNKDQYEMQYQLPGSSERVDFAIKLPGSDDGNTYVFLPIDAKFPADAYQNLLDAYESGNIENIKNARSTLMTRIQTEAKSIHDKYIMPPYTTDFAVLFLPFEGLYSEVVNLGLLEPLQNKYHINIAGPSTMAAMLNSFRMGFRTLAIQKRSGEVWKTLEAVKKEFETFEQGLAKMKERLSQADSELDKLIGTRTNQINRKLKNVTAMESLIEAEDILSE